LTATRIPSAWVAQGYGIPDVCSRHGAVAVQRKRVTFVSTPPGWSYPLLLFGIIPFMVVAALTRKSVTAAGWPFCARCKQTRTVLLGIGFALLVLCIVGLTVSIALASGGPAGARSGPGVLGVLAIVMLAFVGGLLFVLAGTYQFLANAHVSRDGMWVQIARAHPRFAQQVTANVVAAGSVGYAVPDARRTPGPPENRDRPHP
jgi:hypothetical protein